MRATPLALGSISKAKRARLVELRARILDLMRVMAQVGFSPEPLDQDLTDKDLDAKLLEVQRSAQGLNSVWREQARMRVKPSLEESVSRYFSRLCGGLRYVDQHIPKADRHPDSRRRYFHIPESVQDTITADEIAALKSLGESGQGLDAFRQWRSGQHAFTPAQVAVLEYIHIRAQQKHTPPTFAAQDDFILQIHVDARMVPANNAAPAKALRDGVPMLLKDDTNRVFHRFLDLAGIESYGKRIRLPLVLPTRMAQRLESSRDEWASLIVELGVDTIGVRLVCGKPPEGSPETVRTFVGRDFGYTNTISLSVAEIDQDCRLEEARNQLMALDTQESVRRFLTSNQQREGLRVVERVRFKGRAFLRRIDTLCKRIDGYKSRIDRAYNSLDVLKKQLVADLGLQAQDLITPKMKRQHPGARDFFQQLGLISDLKKTRRALYRKIAAIKKAWFGMLSNYEITLAKRYQAAICREDLTVTTIEKDAPDYRGRTFNKMLNAGSKGQYQRRASAKMLWNGVPEIVLPSWYTSRTCPRHGHIAEKHHRQGERLHLPCCQRTVHADEHAADVIAGYPVLQPLTRPARL